MENKMKGAMSVIGVFICFLSVYSAESTDYFADNGQGGPINVLQNPSIAYHNKTSYAVYQGAGEDAYISAYDHESAQWSGPVRVGESFLKDGDGHGKPVICIADDGYIHVVFGGHGGHSSFGDNTAHSYERRNRTLGNAGKQTHMRSDKPGDISSWSELENISPFGTYSQLIKMDDGDIYLFYRHGGHKSDWVYQRSADNGQTFEPEVIVMDAVEFGGGVGVEAWYMFFRKGIGDTIVCTYAYHPCSYENHIDERFNVYYMQMDCQDHSWRNAAGSVLAMPLTKSLADARARVVETEEGTTRVLNGSVDVSPEGMPWIIYPRGQGRLLYVTRWTGSLWTPSVRVAEDAGGWQKGDLEVVSAEEARALVSGKDSQTGMLGLWQYRTIDGGINWNREKDIFVDNSVCRKEPSAIIKKGHSDAHFLVAAARGKKEPGVRVYLYGENGFVPRESR